MAEGPVKNRKPTFLMRKMCPVKNRLAFSVYMLTGKAEHWCISTKSILEERDELVTWETFRERFLLESFPDSI